MVVKRIILQSKNESTHETVSATVSPCEPIIILFEKQKRRNENFIEIIVKRYTHAIIWKIVSQSQRKQQEIRSIFVGWSSQHILLWQMNAILMFMFKLIIDVLRLLKFHYFSISFCYLSICLSVFLSFSLYSIHACCSFYIFDSIFFLNISLKLNSRNTDVSSLASIYLAYKYTLRMSLNVSIWNSIVFLW